MLIFFVVVAFVALIFLFRWAIRLRGGVAYHLGVAFTFSLAVMYLLAVPFVYGLNVGDSEANTFASFFDGLTRLSVLGYIPALLMTLILFLIAYICGAKQISQEMESTKVSTKKWMLYVAFNFVLVNGILYQIVFSLNLTRGVLLLHFLIVLVLLVGHYPILCKMRRWFQKSLILAATMIIYFVVLACAKDGKFDIGELYIIPFSVVGGSFPLMLIIWINYALRKRLF